ncbi:hypothetical protein B0H19DRAFT_1235159 [Mycena capillaripes]|nr:hypothetical protein B0H19DRAFT_1235159 [Mycena capillaripes]
MTDVQELQARIAKLSDEINLQKDSELLKKLEHDKSLVQRQLNAVFDPVARLSLEISSQIFLQSLPLLPAPDPSNVPMLLLNVCSAWTDIALSTPGLWTAIKITLSCAERFKDRVHVWLQRAGNRPLSISFVGPRSMDQSIMGIIWEYEQQLKHLEICYEKEDDEDSGGFPEFLGGRSPGLMPSLETLKIRASDDEREGYGHFAPQILEVLRLAPNLIEFVFDNIQYVVDVDTTVEKLALPGLRRLIFGGGYETYPNSNGALFSCLTLPALETLSLSLHKNSSDNVFDFLKCSSPPLKQLGMRDASRGGLDFVELQECFYLIPTLTDLTVWEPRMGFMAGLCAALADSLSLLPNLHILKIVDLYCLTDRNADSLWKTLLRVLSSRRTQLRIVHIELENLSMKSAADALVEFRDLVADGMQIYIGYVANSV